jgi:hypothetical protein
MTSARRITAAEESLKTHLCECYMNGYSILAIFSGLKALLLLTVLEELLSANGFLKNL